MLVTDYKCRVCKCDLDDDNCSYEDEICDECYEKEFDEQLAERDE